MAPPQAQGGRLAGPRHQGSSAEQIALRIGRGQPDQDTNFCGDAIPKRLIENYRLFYGILLILYGVRHQMDEPTPSLEVVDTSGLTDADWAELNKLKAAYDNGGPEALSKGMEKLAADPDLYARVMGALFPDRIPRSLRDKLAKAGTAEDEIRELLRKLQSQSPKSH